MLSLGKKKKKSSNNPGILLYGQFNDCVQYISSALSSSVFFCLKKITLKVQLILKTEKKI